MAFFAFSFAAVSVIVKGQLTATSDVDRNEINRLMVENAVAQLRAEFVAQLESSNNRIAVLESLLAATSANSHECT